MYRFQAVAVSPDGTTMASGSFDRSVKLWDMATYESPGRSCFA
ncbi:MAG: hypothetical protein ACC645_27505 [Pirellulales bacterium]